MDMERPWFNYPIKTYEVTDGDTVKVSLDLGFYLSYRVKVRLMGCDTPETRPLATREAGKAAKRATSWWLKHFKEAEGFRFLVFSAELPAKYHNRIVGDIVAWNNRAQFFRLSEFLLAGRLARPYDGAGREPWSARDLQNVINTDPAKVLELQMES